MTELGDLLAAAGYSSGDPFGSFVVGNAGNESTSSNTYSSLFVGDLDHCQLIWDDMFPGSVTVEAIVYFRGDGTGDQLDVRLQNVDDGETVMERTGITTGFDRFSIGPVAYEPTTTSDVVQFFVQARNSDNTTTVEVQDATVIFRPQV